VIPSASQFSDIHKIGICLPSGEKATKLTQCVWPSSAGSSYCPVAASQRRTVLSSDPDTICLPSGEKATELTPRVWPSSAGSSYCPVAASQRRTVLSSDPDTICLPSGEKATELTQSVWPSSVCSIAFQYISTLGFPWIQDGIYRSNVSRTMLFSGTKTRAEQYTCRGACSIINRLNIANRDLSFINVYKSGLLLHFFN